MQLLNRAPGGLTALTALIVLIFIGMPFLTILRRETPWSTWMLLAIAVACGMRLLRTLRTRQTAGDDRMVATRDLTAVIAALVACIAVATGMSWARGTAVVAIEFVMLLEFLRHRRLAA